MLAVGIKFIIEMHFQLQIQRRRDQFFSTNGPSKHKGTQNYT